MDNPGTPAAVQPEQQTTPPTPTGEEIDWKKEAEVAEQRRKDTQASYTKGQQELKALKMQNEKLLEEIQKLSSPTLELSAEELQDLDDLKVIDPDKWRIKMNTLEAEARGKLTQRVMESQKYAEDQLELERRASVLAEWNQTHPEAMITEETLASELPPRYLKDLTEGKITFEQYLEKAHKFLTSGKIVSNEEVLGQPNLGSMSGGHSPQQDSNKQEVRYKDVIF